SQNDVELALKRAVRFIELQESAQAAGRRDQTLDLVKIETLQRVHGHRARKKQRSALPEHVVQQAKTEDRVNRQVAKEARAVHECVAEHAIIMCDIRQYIVVAEGNRLGLARRS